jgi:hypothetical protein
LLLALGLLAALFLLPEADALAIPADPPRETDATLDEGQSRPILARRRRWGRKKKAKRRRPRRRRKRPRPKAAEPEPAPEPAPAAEPAPSSPAVDPGNLRRGGRVEFDGRLVQGQTAKSGAIYLFARKRSQLRSMVEERVEYRKEILRTVYMGSGSSASGESKQK